MWDRERGRGGKCPGIPSTGDRGAQLLSLFIAEQTSGTGRDLPRQLGAEPPDAGSVIWAVPVVGRDLRAGRSRAGARRLCVVFLCSPGSLSPEG